MGLSLEERTQEARPINSFDIRPGWGTARFLYRVLKGKVRSSGDALEDVLAFKYCLLIPDLIIYTGVIGSAYVIYNDIKALL